MNEHFQEKLLEELQKRFSVIPSERDTHFANAAKLLVDKMMATNAMDTLDADRFLDNDDLTELQTLFAQFTYDVAIHAICAYDDAPPELVRELIEHVPDLAQWPISPGTS